MFAAASSFFARSNIFQNYNVGGSSSIVGSRSGTPAQGSPSNAGPLPAPATSSAFFVGPWKVQSGSHKTTNKRVSIWSFDKKSPDLEKMGPASKDRTLEVLKSEVRTIMYSNGFFLFTPDPRRLHLCRDLDIHAFWVRARINASVLPTLTTLNTSEMAEPLEETRSELIFATEPLLSSLYLSIPNSNHRSPIVELDEVEVIDRLVPVHAVPADESQPPFRSKRASSNYARGSPFSTPLHA